MGSAMARWYVGVAVLGCAVLGSAGLGPTSVFVVLVVIIVDLGVVDVIDAFGLGLLLGSEISIDVERIIKDRFCGLLLGTSDTGSIRLAALLADFVVGADAGVLHVISTEPSAAVCAVPVSGPSGSHSEVFGFEDASAGLWRGTST